MIFGVLNTEETRHRKVTNLPTSPVNCCRITLRSVVSDFETIFYGNVT